MIPERIQDICCFLIAFHTPISLSTPHIYISGRPFLPSQSPLSRILDSEFTRAIKMRVGNQSSWPAPPVEWTGHAGPILSVIYSPNGARVVTGSDDKTIRIWDTESGAIVGEPLTGHNGWVQSVAYSPNGQHIISGSSDCTIRIWDAETGAPVGDPLEGHTDSVLSVAYSPNGQHITSGSYDCTIRIWDAETAILSRGTLAWCCLLLTLQMGSTSSLDPSTAPFEYGMPRLVLQLATLLRDTLTVCHP